MCIRLFYKPSSYHLTMHFGFAGVFQCSWVKTINMTCSSQNSVNECVLNSSISEREQIVQMGGDQFPAVINLYEHITNDLCLC